MDDKNPRTFTQADVDSIVQKRIAEERVRYGAELEQREKDLATREFNYRLSEQAKAEGIPQELVDALGIKDEESMKKAFAALKPLVNKHAPAPGGNPPPVHVPDNEAALLKGAFGLKKG